MMPCLSKTGQRAFDNNDSEYWDKYNAPKRIATLFSDTEGGFVRQGWVLLNNEWIKNTYQQHLTQQNGQVLGLNQALRGYSRAFLRPESPFRKQFSVIRHFKKHSK